MKLKYYLRGAGIGIIVTTLILMISFHVYEGSRAASEETETEAEELTIAEALADTVETERAASDPVTEADALPAHETENLTVETEALPETEAAAGTEIVAETEETAEAENTQESAVVEPDEAKRDVVIFEIFRGDSPGAVAKRLYESGIIADEQGFYRYLVENGLNDSLETGVFDVPRDAEFSEIAGILTTNEYERRMRED